MFTVVSAGKQRVLLENPLAPAVARPRTVSSGSTKLQLVQTIGRVKSPYYVAKLAEKTDLSSLAGMKFE
ncbi:hypothetical protein HY993_01795 [Candidatus Micrarchaeota archaeon]|nr:hypothetical protein [Candidatus Micrarchaeota archaeon]